MDELTALSQTIKERASQVQDGLVAVRQALIEPLRQARNLLVGELDKHVGITGHEFKNSGLLEALMMLLTWAPHQVKRHLAAEAERNNAKRSSLLDWTEPTDGDS